MNNPIRPETYKRVRNILFLLISLLAVVILTQGLLNLFIMPRMKISQILLESTLRLPDQTLLSLGGIKGEVNYLTLDEKALQDTYELSPLIRKAYVQKQFPNSLKIVLYGRNPLGVSLLVEDGLCVPVIFDEKGVLFHKGETGTGADLPILSGIKYGEVQEGMTLPDSLLPLLANLKVLQDDSPLLFNQLSEIRVDKKSGDLFDLTLFLEAFITPVKTTAVLDEELLKKILLVLDVLKGRNMLAGVEYADFRSGQVVLKMREDG